MGGCRVLFGEKGRMPLFYPYFTLLYPYVILCYPLFYPCLSLSKEDYPAARDCFVRALRQGQSKEALQLLSMVLRKIPAADAEERLRLVGDFRLVLHILPYLPYFTLFYPV